MHKRLLTLGITSGLLLAGCNTQNNEETMKAVNQGEQQNQVNEQQVEIQAPIMSEKQAAQHLMLTLTSMQSTLKKLGTDNGWVWSEKDPELTFSMVKDALQHLATDEFIDNVIAENYKGFYSATHSFIPLDIEADVRTTVKQDNDTLHLETFAPAWELDDNGKWYTFDFIYTDKGWLLSGWDSRPLDNLSLTAEEAEQLTRYDDSGKTTFTYLGTDQTGDYHLFEIDRVDNEPYIRALNKHDTTNYTGYDLESVLTYIEN